MAKRENKQSFVSRWFEPRDAAGLAVWRVLFGLLMLIEVIRYLTHTWIRRYYIDPEFHFTYLGFDWVTPWPGDGMYIHFVVLGALSLFIMLGLFYRAAAWMLCLGFVYVFLCEKAHYLNHFYLVSLVCFLMAIVPAHRGYSLDAKLWPKKLGAKTVPAWARGIFLAQFVIVYTFAGIAKLNPDWLNGLPLRMWLSQESGDTPLLGPLLAQEWAAYAFSYAGLLLDLFVGFVLLSRRIRWLGVAALVVFHIANALIFSIGIFPWFMLAATTLFFEPDWPHKVPGLRRWFGHDKKLSTLQILRELGGLALLLMLIGYAVLVLFFDLPEWLYAGYPAVMVLGTVVLVATRDRAQKPEAPTSPEAPPTRFPVRKPVVAFIVAYLAVQILLPLRHHLYPEDVAWNEEGHRFSWRMKLRDKIGWTDFFVTDPVTGETTEIDLYAFLSDRQVYKMDCQPDMILEFAHYLRDTLPNHGEPLEVRAEADCELNGRPSQVMIDRSVNLSEQPLDLWHRPWVSELVD